MRYLSIKYHLRPYKILERRKTTINHAFAAAIAPFDIYEESRFRRAVEILGQDPDEVLRCVYCNEEAQTWDHVFGTVKQSRFSGHGHRLGNLVPSCKKCNSSKGNKNWKDFLMLLGESQKLPSEVVLDRERAIQKYLTAHPYLDAEPKDSPDYDRLSEIRSEVLDLLKEADELAEKIRAAG